jgi:XTP/dITP diphosphohydrolase
MQEKAAGVGFDWNTKEQVWNKYMEELAELDQAMIQGDSEAIEAEFGDVLFSLINYARFLKINPESALERTNQKFIQRFQFIESQAKEQGSSIEKLSLDEMEALWQQAKN